jgi:iron complex outermembrane receptor protein
LTSAVLSAVTVTLAGPGRASLASAESPWAKGREAAEAPSPAPSPTCRGRLDLHVIDVFMHEPVEGALVITNGARAGTTDERGRLAIEGLCATTAKIEVVHPGFQGVTRSLTITEHTSVELELDPVFEDITVVDDAPPPAEMHATSVISGEALERRRGQSLSETLADLPGVGQLRAGTGMAKPVVRGFFGQRVPMLVDGVRHRAQDWGLDHAPEIDPAIASEIAVVKGAAGVRYGPDAIGGVVLVTPSSLRRTPGQAAESHLTGFANGLGVGFIGRAQVVPASLPKLSLQLEGSLKRRRSASTPDYALDNTSEWERAAGATVGYFDGTSSYRLSFRHFEADLGVCTCYRVESADDFFAQLGSARPLNADLYRSDFTISRPFQSVAHELVLARGRWLAGSFGTVTATYALQLDHRREYDVVRQATTGPQFSFKMWTHDLDATVEHRPIHITDHLHLTGTLGAAGMFQEHAFSGLPLVPSHQGVSGGVYAIERLWGDDYEIEAGLRYDHLSRTASMPGRDFLRLVRSGQLARGTCDPGSNESAAVACSSAFQSLSASVGGLVRLGKRLSAKLDLSTASRPPNPDEQYINGTSPTFPVFGLGQPDLGVETSHSVSITTSYRGTRLSGEVSAYANYISDYIYFAPAVDTNGQPIFDVIIRGAFPRFSTRAVDAVFFGVDGNVLATPVPWLTLAAQGSVVRARNVTDDTYLVFIPPDRYRVTAEVSQTAFLGVERAFAMLGAAYTARQSRFDLAADLAVPPDGYLLAEASMGIEKRIGEQTVKVALQGTNLLATRYREYTSLLRYFADQPGRQVMLRITVGYESSNQPR